MSQISRRFIIQEFLADEPPTEEDFILLELLRPKTRADCMEGIRPCPFVGCRYHLYMEVGAGKMRSLLPNFQEHDPTELKQSCALDVAEQRGPSTLAATGKTLNLTRERVRQIQKDILKKLGDSAPNLRDLLQKDCDMMLTKPRSVG